MPLGQRAPLRVGVSAQQLNDALRAAGLLKRGRSDEEEPRAACTMGPFVTAAAGL